MDSMLRILTETINQLRPKNLWKSESLQICLSRKIHRRTGFWGKKKNNENTHRRKSTESIWDTWLWQFYWLLPLFYWGIRCL